MRLVYLGLLYSMCALVCVVNCAEDSSLRIASHIPKHKSVLLDKQIDDFAFTDMSSRTGTLATLCADNKAVVIAVHDVDCPVSMRYGPELRRIEAHYKSKNTVFIHVNMTADEERARIVASIAQRKFTSRVVYDKTSTISSALQATSTCEVFVIDSARTLRYRGAINDQYGIGFTKDAATAHYLRQAIDSVLSDTLVTINQTTAPGCVLDYPQASTIVDRKEEITYHRHISRIMQKNCVQCHRPNGVAPFSLNSYLRVKRKARTISRVLKQGIMPPWFASPEHGGPWKNDMSMSASDKQFIAAWIAGGKIEGDSVDKPVKIQWQEDWQIGNPDYVIRFPRVVKIPAEGTIPYVYGYSKINIPEDKWVVAMEVRTQARSQMHHVLFFQEAPRQEKESDKQYRRRRQGGTRTFFGGAVPGKFVTRFEAGRGKRLRSQSFIKFQLHYTSNGVAAEDQIEVAFVFADKKPRHEIHTRSAYNDRIVIPPHAKNHVQRAQYIFKQDMMLTTFNPHAHVRSTAFQYLLIYPDGKREIVLDIPRYDFNWQMNYELAQGLHVPQGSRLIVSCWYDNSAANPANPDPNKEVRFGEQTWDEMLIGYFEGYTVDGSPMKDGVGQRERAAFAR